MKTNDLKIDDRIKLIVDKFSQYRDWEDRYKYLIDLGKSLPEMNEEFKTESNKVKGCQSQVWLFATFNDEQGLIVFKADSDASIVKGLVGLLTQVYSHSTPDEILKTKPDFIGQIGLVEHLSMSRANGLNSMVKQIMFYAMAFKAKQSMK